MNTYIHIYIYIYGYTYMYIYMGIYVALEFSAASQQHKKNERPFFRFCFHLFTLLELSSAFPMTLPCLLNHTYSLTAAHPSFSLCCSMKRCCARNVPSACSR